MHHRRLQLLGTVALLLALGLISPPFVSAGQLPAARAVASTPSNICFIPTLYHQLLSRSPNHAEIANGLTLLGTNTRSDYATFLLSSNEYRTDLIQGTYGKFLGRSATGSEVSFWLTFLGGGGTDEQFSATILGSLEYFSLPRVGGVEYRICHGRLSRCARSPRWHK